MNEICQIRKNIKGKSLQDATWIRTLFLTSFQGQAKFLYEQKSQNIIPISSVVSKVS